MLELAEIFTKSGVSLGLTNTRKNSCALDEQFDLKVKNVKQGLYVCIFKNDNKEFAIRDNNSSKNQKGNVTIQKQGASVKFGKFEMPLRQKKFLIRHLNIFLCLTLQEKN